MRSPRCERSAPRIRKLGHGAPPLPGFSQGCPPSRTTKGPSTGHASLSSEPSSRPGRQPRSREAEFLARASSNLGMDRSASPIERLPFGLIPVPPPVGSSPRNSPLGSHMGSGPAISDPLTQNPTAFRRHPGVTAHESLLWVVGACNDHTTRRLTSTALMDVTPIPGLV